MPAGGRQRNAGPKWREQLGDALAIGLAVPRSLAAEVVRSIGQRQRLEEHP
jgi:hypothetical protein